MTNYANLLQRHSELLTEIDNGVKPKILLKQVYEFMSNIEKNSPSINKLEEREHLQSIILYWSSFVYQYSGKYPEIKLRPATSIKSKNDIQSVSLKKRRKTDSVWISMGIGVASLIGIVSLVLFIALVTNYLNNLEIHQQHNITIVGTVTKGSEQTPQIVPSKSPRPNEASKFKQKFLIRLDAIVLAR